MKVRTGHDLPCAIGPARITEELGLQPRHIFEMGLEAKVDWNLANLDCCETVRHRPGFDLERLCAEG